ncbi:alginate lyase family protein [Shewanella algae]|uniref:alginate lyase family protein n=1 Tax=Shewanella algae TaxID=38313 RepID=UPI0031F4D7F8
MNITGNLNNWNDRSKDKLWLYNLHYFNELNAGDVVLCPQRIEFLNSIIGKWIDENPPIEGNGWEAYPLSLRIVNWIKYFHEIVVPYHFEASLYLQTRVLEQKLEYHLLGNHLFANAKALVFSGCYFNDEIAKTWLNKGLKIVDVQINEQVLNDGGNFELSPMYHNIMLLDMLDLYNLSNAYDVTELNVRKEHWKSIIIKMLQWSRSMSHPDGEISFFNDAAFNVAPKTCDLNKYKTSLGIIEENEVDNIQEVTGLHLIDLPDSGYKIVESSSYKFIIDVADIGASYIPGHGHADVLSFEASFFGNRVFVNTGTSVYKESGQRSYERSTEAHNTVVVNDKSSSEVWAGFRVAKRAYPKSINSVVGDNKVAISASHDGYSHMKGRPKHFRYWEFNSNFVVIVDKVEGTFETAIGFLHLHPSVDIIYHCESKLKLMLQSGSILSLEFDTEIEIVNAYWAPEFGKKINCNKIKYVIPKDTGVASFRLTF